MKSLRALMALVSAFMPSVAFAPDVAPTARGAPGSHWGGGRISNRRRAIKADLIVSRERAAMIRETPRLRNAAKRLRQGRLSATSFRAMVALHGAS